MVLPIKWLNQYVDLSDVDNASLIHELTMSGSKVETLEYLGEGIENVVVGRAVSVEKHPDSDHLNICKIDVGGENDLQIVTGAQNVTVGALVPVALNGSELPGGIKIKTGKLRGVVSEGMLCSIAELGLTLHECPYAVEDGILILQNGTPGEDIKKTLGLDEYCIEFEITPNRPDCLSVVGLAREAAATYDRPLKLEPPRRPEGEGSVADYLSVSIESKLCRRYMARAVKDVKIAPSPAWLRERLHAAGVRPINNIVDITNYVMLEYGQPMHAFDYACLDGSAITVRTAAEGELMNTLDGKERKLSADMLVIADSKKPVAVAGVMGGENSEITESTKTVIFESANFDGTSVRLTSRALGMRTDSSGRFEKGLPPELALPAIDRACELVEELGAGTVVGGLIDVYPDKVRPGSIKPDYKRINQLLGTELEPEVMDGYFARVGLEKLVDGSLEIPYWRSDIECTADLAEEVARLYGYGNIPTTMFDSVAEVVTTTPAQELRNRLDELCTGLGFDETVTYTFISPKYYDKICLPADSVLRKSVKIINPLGEDTSVMRTTALPSMLEVAAYNQNVRNAAASLYEIGVVYTPVLGEDGEVDPEALPAETRKLMLVKYGAGESFFTLKGVVEAVLERVTGIAPSFTALSDDPSFHPGRTASVTLGDIKVGVLGEIAPAVADNYGFNDRVYAAELDIDSIVAAGSKKPSYEKISRFPALLRDIAVVCDEAVTIAELSDTIRSAAGKLLKKVELFDIYRGERMEKGKKSVAFSLSFADENGTVEDTRADAAFAKIVKNLESKHGAILRS
ncbi:MAG: phenylalanine--tRNA ligase subunit beta [Clostridia bacterium]|nr:phenylalanine--tRNA ligase subunit beta [Clostridia bacterium]